MGENRNQTEQQTTVIVTIQQRRFSSTSIKPVQTIDSQAEMTTVKCTNDTHILGGTNRL